MTGAASTLSQYLPRSAATCRIRLALAVSACFHLLLAVVLAFEMPPRSFRSESIAPIRARIELLLWPRPVQVAAASKEKFSKPRPVRHDVALADEVRREAEPKISSGLEQGATPLPALPQTPDPTVYMARDLDSYPRPVFPLDIERIAERTAGLPPAGVRLELLIDEHGIVSDVTLAGSDSSVQRSAELRAALAATRFIPASRDGRAVRSRILLNIDFTAAGGSKMQPKGW